VQAGVTQVRDDRKAGAADPIVRLQAQIFC